MMRPVRVPLEDRYRERAGVDSALPLGLFFWMALSGLAIIIGQL